MSAIYQTVFLAHRIYRKQTEKDFFMHEVYVYQGLRVIKHKYKNAIRRRKIKEDKGNLKC